jgi:hypothetical protein
MDWISDPSGFNLISTAVLPLQFSPWHSLDGTVGRPVWQSPFLDPQLPFDSLGTSSMVRQDGMPISEPDQQVVEHSKTIQKVAETPGFDSDATKKLVSEFTTPGVATLITNYLQSYFQRYFRATKRPITGLQASLIQPFTSEFDPWPIVIWEEGVNTNVMAVFKVEAQFSRCSCLMHYGHVRNWCSSEIGWKHASIAWLVDGIENLRELFIAVHYAFAFNYGQDAQLLSSLANQKSRGCSKEELTSL